MAGPINGIGAQQAAQQIATATQGRDDSLQAREREEDQDVGGIERGEAIRGADVGAVEAQGVDAQNQEQSEFQRQLDQLAATELNAEAERGSLIDITV